MSGINIRLSLWLLIFMLLAPGCCPTEMFEKSCATPEHYGARHSECGSHGLCYGVANPGCYGYQPTCWHAWPCPCGPCVGPTGLPAEVCNAPKTLPNCDTASNPRQASELHVALRSDGA
jgi:hypothetical protein